MSNLKYKTISNTTPRGKAKIFFTCHEEDFNKYFESVCQDIFSLFDCSIWYLDDYSLSMNDYADDLLSMQLLVIPITSKLLTTTNKALEVFQFAVEHNIPILPLMKEKNLEEQFNNVCGNIQFLDKFKKDDTGLSYKEKLNKFLSEVLIKDEIVNKIKSAFDAYVFLSYRKKDRKHADKLMRLIHKNKFCRDIAIWYDEFLVPGEDFNDAIKDALVNSDLFVLTVTPNLVNENNYIINIEYPMAQQEGKPILPVELVKTDTNKLKLTFKDFPNLIDSNDEIKLSDALINQLKIIATESNNTPEHDYFIGLAYLAGIDVEVDYEKALELITSSADRGLIEAIEKLIEMYRNGIGVKRSHTKIIELINRKIDILEFSIKNDFTNDQLVSLINTYIELSDCLLDILKTSEAITSLMKALELSIHDGINDNLKITIHDKLAIIYTKELQYSKAIYHFEEELKLSNNLDSSLNSQLLTNLKLGKVFSLKNDYNSAVSYYLKALNLQKELLAINYNDEDEMNLINIYKSLGNIYLSLSDIYNAKQYLEKAFEIVYKYCFKPNGIEYGDELIYISLSLIQLHILENKYSLANFYSIYTKSLSAGLFERKDTINYKLMGIDSLLEEANLNILRGLKDDVSSIYKEALQMALELHKVSDTIKVKERLHRCYSHLINLSKDIDEALSYHILDRKILDSLKDNDNIYIKQMFLEHYDTIGTFLYKNKKFDKALEFFIKEFEVANEIMNLNPIINNKRQLSSIYGKLGFVYYQKYDDLKAKENFLNQYLIRKELLSENNNINQILDYGLACYNLSLFDNKIEYILEAIKYTKLALEKNNSISIRKRLSSYLKRIIKLYELEKNNLSLIYKKELEDNELIINKLDKASRELEVLYASYISSKLMFIKNPNENSLKQTFGSIYQLISIEDYNSLDLNKELSSLFTFISEGYKTLGDEFNSNKYQLCADYSLNDVNNPVLLEELHKITIEVNSSLIDINWKNDNKKDAVKQMSSSIELINKYEINIENQKKLIKYYNLLGVYYLYDVDNEKEKALMYFNLELKEKELLIQEENNFNSKKSIIDSFYSLISYNQEINNFDKMLEYLIKVENYAQKLHNTYQNDQSLYALADVYLRYSYFYECQMKNLDMAIKYRLIYIDLIEELLKIDKKYIEDLEIAYYSLASLYKKNNQEDKYIEYQAKRTKVK